MKLNRYTIWENLTPINSVLIYSVERGEYVRIRRMWRVFFICVIQYDINVNNGK